MTTLRKMAEATLTRSTLRNLATRWVCEISMPNGREIQIGLWSEASAERRSREFRENDVSSEIPLAKISSSPVEFQ